MRGCEDPHMCVAVRIRTYATRTPTPESAFPVCATVLGRLVVRNGTTSKRIEQEENQKRNGTAQVAKMLPPLGQKRPPRLRRETKRSMAASDGQKHTSEDPPRTKLGLLRLSRWSKHTMICTTTKRGPPRTHAKLKTNERGPPKL